MTTSLFRAVRPALLLVVAAAIVASGCSHKVESPAVAGKSVSPDLACNAQLSSPIVISGSGFTPMPSKTLAGTKALILPSVTLLGSQDLTGAPVPGAKPVAISGNPGGEFSTNLSWQSESLMTLSVDESLALDPGLYDITVTNPDGEQKAKISQALAIVPPPSITDLVPPALCDDQSDQTLTIEGSGFLQVGDALPTVTIKASDGTVHEYAVTAVTGCAPIPGRDPAVQTCNTATITIPKGDLPPGDYTVVLTNPAPAACSSTDGITLTVNPPPTVTSVAPQKVCSGGSVLDVTGTGFQDKAKVTLDCGNGNPVDATSVTVNSDTSLTATFGPGVNDGDTCQVIVTNPDGCFDTPPHQEVTGTEGPILFYVDPPVVYNGINTVITMYVTSVTGTPTVTITPGTGCTGATDTTLANPKVSGNQIQAVVKKGQAACTYNVTVTDGSGCAATLPDGLTVVDKLTLTLTAIEPPFGQTTELVPVQITGSGFKATPRAFLNPHSAGANDVAIPIEGVTMVDATKLTAVVPQNTPVGWYDLVVVNPSGEVGVLQTNQGTVNPNNGAYESLQNPPPSITGITPQSVVNQAGQSLTVTGTGLNGGSVSFDCRDRAGNPVASPTATSTCTATSCTATVDASATPNGAICVVQVTVGNSTAKFSALGITNSSLNLQAPVAGTNMHTGRRALLAAAVRANSVSRFVYAVGGDGGTGAPFQSVEFANVDLFGNMTSWITNRESLATARAFLGGSAVGRYVYAFGGTDGTNDLKSGQRALVLSPSEAPHIDFGGVDLCLGGGKTPCFSNASLGTGLAAGQYSYRVAATIDPADAVNLGGDTLASDPIIFKLPDINGRKVLVQLKWLAPVDDQGTKLTGITGYKIYRTPKDGVPGQAEVLIDTITDPNTLAWIDDGTKTAGTEKPLPPGSTSAWKALPDLGTARRALATVTAQDPADATKTYVYALEGEGLTSYEYLTVTTQANGRQTIGASWAAGSQNADVERYEFGAYAVTAATTSLVTAPDTWIYLGGGKGTGGPGGKAVSTVAAKVQAGGDLGAFDLTPDDFNNVPAGYGAFVASTKLFIFGGDAAGGPTNKASGAEMQTPLPTLVNWNNEGITMTTARYLPGTATQSAFVFFVGGQASAGGAALVSTESLAW